MKKLLFRTAWLALALSTSTLLSRADDGEGGGGTCTNWWSGTTCTNGDDTAQGGDISGSETLIASVTLVPTTNAPDGTTGVVNLVSDNEDGITTTACSITTTGLVSGVYDVSVVRKSDGSTVDLGTIFIRSHHGGDDNEDGDNQGDDNGGEDHEGDHCGTCTNSTFSERCFSGGFTNVSFSDVELPSDLDPMDISQVIISDMDGNAILIGDFVDTTTSSSIQYSASVKASTSTKGTNGGKALAKSIAKHGKRKDHITVLGSGLTPNTKFSVVVNGQTVGTVKSNKKGNALVSKVHSNLLTVRVLRLVDPSGNTQLTTKF